MKPYKIGSLWCDLDRVFGMSERTTISFGGVYGEIYRDCQAAPIQTYLGNVTYDKNGDPKEEEIGPIRDEWGAFKIAWQTKDTMFGGSK